MNTAVTALLNEIEEYGEEGPDMPQEDAEFYPDDSVHGQFNNLHSCQYHWFLSRHIEL